MLDLNASEYQDLLDDSTRRFTKPLSTAIPQTDTVAKPKPKARKAPKAHPPVLEIDNEPDPYEPQEALSPRTDNPQVEELQVLATRLSTDQREEVIAKIQAMLSKEDK